MPPKGKELIFDAGLVGDQHIPGTRALYQFYRTTCSTGYAITLPGAKKLIKYFKESDSNLDIQLSAVCTRHADMSCLGIWPQLVTSSPTESNIKHTGAGDTVQVADDGDSERWVGDVRAGPGIQFSARVNAEPILREGKNNTEWKAAWDTMWASSEWEEEGGKKDSKLKGKQKGNGGDGDKNAGEDKKGDGMSEGKEGDASDRPNDWRWIEVPLNRTDDVKRELFG